MSESKISYNLDPSTADAVEQDRGSLTAAEGQMPGTNPPPAGRRGVTDKILGYNPGKNKPRRMPGISY
jgi:hypothetical protein